MVAVGAAVLGGAACGGGSSARDGGGAGHDGGDAGGDAARCSPSGDLTAEPPPRQVALDGGVPIDQLAHALAVARCNYVSRCYALGTYLANECVDSLVNYESWPYQSCGNAAFVGSFCVWTGLFYYFPTADLPQAVAAGVVHYDAQKEAVCIAALLAEGCAGEVLLENVPACAGVFTCASGPDGGGAGTADGGVADAGSACAQLIPPNEPPLQTCSTDADCIGVTGSQQGPDCVAGICAPSRCGITVGGCSSFAAAGQPCNANANSPLNASAPTTPAGICAPGLACHGETADGGLGTCVAPLDLDGTCTDDTNCKPGLTCGCGTCEIPPSTGACVNGLCKVGVAYCDLGNNVCRPVRPYGASCSDAFNSCGPGLLCNGDLCKPFS
jgi:hypothetical protein